MRVLQVHTGYREAGGEDRVVEAEARLLRSAGHEVDQHLAANPVAALPSVAALGRAPWNPRAAREVVASARRLRPDVVHVHNTWFALSPAVVAGVAAAGFPVVLTLHNYRLACIAGTLHRDGHRCTDCVGRGPLPGVVHRCYRDSALLSGVAAATVGLHRRRGTWSRDVRLYLAPSPVVEQAMVGAGLAAARVRVKPHFTDDPGPRPAPPSRSGRVLFAGRLSPEKGVDVLVEAWAAAPAGLELVIAGDGPLAGALRGRAGPGVRFLGAVPADALSREMLGARALVFPSTWEEPFGLVLVEAMAHGLAVVGSDAGATRWIVDPLEDGQLVRPGDPASLAAALARLADDAFVDRAAEAGRKAYEARFTPPANLELLEDAYRQAAA